MSVESLRALADCVSRIAAATALDRESDPNRVLPEIAPAELWRVYPRLLRAAAPYMRTETERTFAVRLAELIEGRAPLPTIGAGKAV